MAELKPNEIAVDREQFKNLLETLQQKNDEIRALYDSSMKVMALLGLAENNRIKADVFEEDGSPFSEVLKGASDIIGLAFKAQGPKWLAGNAEEKLKEKFSFFKELIPLFVKYGNEFGGDPGQNKLETQIQKQLK